MHTPLLAGDTPAAVPGERDSDRTVCPWASQFHDHTPEVAVADIRRVSPAWWEELGRSHLEGLTGASHGGKNVFLPKEGQPTSRQ